MPGTNRELDGRNEALTDTFDMDEPTTGTGAFLTLRGPDFVESPAEDAEPSAEDSCESDPS